MSNGMRRAMFGTALCVAAGVSIGCQPHVSVGSNKNDAPINIAFVAKADDSPIFRLAYNGALQATMDLHRTTGRQVLLEDDSPMETSLDAQIANVRDVISKGTGGIMLSCVDNGLSICIDEAMAKGIPVITFDSDCAESKRLGFYGTDNTRAGEQAADLLVAAMNNDWQGKRVAILSGDGGADNLTRRVEGFNHRIGQAYPTMTVLGTTYCNEQSDICAATLESMLEQFPDLDGLLVTGLWGIQEACDCSFPSYCYCGDEQVSKRMKNWYAATKRGLKTVAFDSHPSELELVKQGYVSALIGQRYYEWGYCPAVAMFKYLSQGQRSDFLDTGSYQVIYPKDVDNVMSRWRELYSGERDASAAEPPDCAEGGL